MTHFVISQMENRDADNFPLYAVHVVDRDAHPLNEMGLLFTTAWDNVVGAMQPGDSLTEQHTGSNPVVLDYETVMESVKRWAEFDAENS